MARLCPKCRKESLEVAKGAFAESGPEDRALFCSSCRGYWMPHGIVERWQTEPFVELSDEDPESVRPEADRRTGLCPMGHGILLRARVDEEKTYYLERCGHCRGVWFDRGEWQALAATLYLDHLDDLWDPAWQKKRRAEALGQRLDRALAEQIGRELFEEIQRVVERLAHHPAKAQALAWITTRLDTDRTR
ncbi:MAG: zf-TFIIB domain-containing protein [Polyangiaceae bacterium]